jgi:signal recognition particle receptor subunit beta
MEMNLLLAGLPGAGVSTALRSALDAQSLAADGPGSGAYEYGALKLSPQETLKLHGTSRAEKLNATWPTWYKDVNGVILLLDHRRETSQADMSMHLKWLQMQGGAKRKPLALGVTHVDENTWRPLHEYRALLKTLGPEYGVAPILRTDPRRKLDVFNLLLAVTGMAEFLERLPKRQGR